MPWASTHLDRRPATVEQVLDDSLGIYGTQPTGHLELAARIDGYDLADLTRVLEVDRSAVRLRTLRGSGFVIPVGLLPVTQAATRAKNARAFAGFVRRGLAEPYETWAGRIEELLAGGPLAAADIRAALDAGPDAGMIRYVISVMAAENRIVAATTTGGWRSDRTTFARWDDWLPGVDVWSMEEGPAQDELARAYLDRHGPATVADFAFWSGLTKTRAQRAVAEVAQPLTGDYWATSAPADDDPPPLRLLPIWDVLFVTYRDRDRFVAPEHYSLVYDASGNATSVVLREGRAAGVWDLGTDDRNVEIQVAAFAGFTPSEWLSIDAEAARIGDLIGAESVRIVRRDGPIDLTAAPRNRFMRPLRAE